MAAVLHVVDTTSPPSLDEIENASSVEEALAIQARIEPLVQIPYDEKEEADEEVTGFPFYGIEKILSLDIAYSTRSELIVASGVLYRFEGKGSKSGIAEIIAEKVISGQAHFPYIPGLLAFREVPLLTSIIDALLPSAATIAGSSSKEKKDGGGGGGGEGGSKTVLLCDGAGIAHPRFCGIASHLGVLYNMPTIGVAKNHLIGTTTLEESLVLAEKRGSHTALYVGDKRVGSVLRSQDGVRPIFVSPGHLISIKQAREVVLYLCQKYRLPEPIRRADHIGRQELKRIEGQADADNDAIV